MSWAEAHLSLSDAHPRVRRTWAPLHRIKRPLSPTPRYRRLPLAADQTHPNELPRGFMSISPTESTRGSHPLAPRSSNPSPRHGTAPRPRRGRRSSPRVSVSPPSAAALGTGDTGSSSGEFFLGLLARSFPCLPYVDCAIVLIRVDLDWVSLLGSSGCCWAALRYYYFLQEWHHASGERCKLWTLFFFKDINMSIFFT
jgi:hypothetical protein